MTFTKNLIVGISLFIMLLLPSVLTYAETAPIKTLVITGGHDFDQAFYDLFKDSPDIKTTFVEQPKANTLFADGSIMKYDVVVLYDLWQVINDKEKQGLLNYLASGKGYVSLHHSIANYQNWPDYLEAIGGSYILDAKGTSINGEHYPQSKFKHDCEMDVSIADKSHPITQGVKDFTIMDEGYKGMYIAPDSRILLTSDHPASTKQIAWTKKYKNNEIVCIQLGHDKKSFENPSYRWLVAQAVRYTAKRPMAVSLLDDDPNTWEATGNAEWSFEDGVLSGRQGAGNAPGDLFTSASYSDFILTVEFKMEWPGNSGVWFRFQSPNKSYQADILEYKNPLCWSGSLYCPGKMFIAMNEDPDIVKKHDWNTFVIRCEGDSLKIDLNGTCVADVTDPLSKEGKIGLQIHAGDEFKDMAIHIRRADLIPLK